MKKRMAESTVKAEVKPGAFRSDGSFDPRAELAARGPIDHLVRMLVRERRSARLTPERAAEVIQAANATSAFPHHRQWLVDHQRVHAGAPVWPLVWSSTAAEEAVKREGRREGHWCGERYLSGAEKDCDAAGHRVVKDPEQVAAHVAAVMRQLSLNNTNDPLFTIRRVPVYINPEGGGGGIDPLVD